MLVSHRLLHYLLTVRFPILYLLDALLYLEKFQNVIVIDAVVGCLVKEVVCFFKQLRHNQVGKERIFISNTL